MTKTYGIEEQAEEQGMIDYLHQGMLLGHLWGKKVEALPVMDGSNYSPNKLIIRVPHPTKDMTLEYTLVTVNLEEG